jgi:hypothetical protein
MIGPALYGWPTGVTVSPLPVVVEIPKTVYPSPVRYFLPSDHLSEPDITGHCRHCGQQVSTGGCPLREVTPSPARTS